MFTVFSGTASDVFELATVLDYVLPSLGWSPYRTVASGASIRDSVYTTVYGEYGTLYARVLASGTNLYGFTYGHYPQTGPNYSYELGGVGYQNPGAANGCTYWVIGDSKFFWVLAKDSSTGLSYSSYLGYYNSYVPSLYDRYPVAVVGQLQDTDTFDDGRTIMYTSASGTVEPYRLSTSYITTAGQPPNSRSSVLSALAVPVALRTATEVRGELFGMVSTAPTSTIPTTTVSGLSGGTYITASSGTDSTCFIGPYSG